MEKVPGKGDAHGARKGGEAFVGSSLASADAEASGGLIFREEPFED